MKYKGFITIFTRAFNGPYTGENMIILLNKRSHTKCGFLPTVLPAEGSVCS
jgi:hypothetical protein